MYSLLVGCEGRNVIADRVFEHTDKSLLDYVQPSGVLDVTRLLSLPALVMPEVGDSRFAPVARVGRITNIARVGRDYSFAFVQSPGLPAFSTDRIATLAPQLGITGWELRRTHWAVKDVDLYGVLLEAESSRQLASRVFTFPIQSVGDPDLVAVMMPFSTEFDPVYAAIREAVEGMGKRCHRADDIWEKHNIIDDVIGLIWRSRVVIADLSAKNPNVFYEIGIAHSLGRDVIQIAQSIDDVPFDIRGIRTLPYLPDKNGLATLKEGLASRIETLTV